MKVNIKTQPLIKKIRLDNPMKLCGRSPVSESKEISLAPAKENDPSDNDTEYL
jgi:hypothetical protein